MLPGKDCTSAQSPLALGTGVRHANPVLSQEIKLVFYKLLLSQEIRQDYHPS